MLNMIDIILSEPVNITGYENHDLKDSWKVGEKTALVMLETKTGESLLTRMSKI